MKPFQKPHQKTTRGALLAPAPRLARGAPAAVARKSRNHEQLMLRAASNEREGVEGNEARVPVGNRGAEEVDDAMAWPSMMRCAQTLACRSRALQACEKCPLSEETAIRPRYRIVSYRIILYSLACRIANLHSVNGHRLLKCSHPLR